MRKAEQKKHRACQWGRKFLLPVLMLFLAFGGCTGKEAQNLSEDAEELSADAPVLYILNQERTKVVSESFDLSDGMVEVQVSELLTALENMLWTKEEISVLLEQNPIYEFKVDEKGLVTLRYAADYNASQSITEVLRRAAIVKTLCQLETVTAVEFYIGSQPLLNSNGKPVGMLSAEDFIDSTGENTEFYQEANLSVYFANETGDALVESNLKITYDGTVTTEQLVLEQLMEGPVLDGMQAVLPKGTVLNKVTIRDGVCYVDFNEKFMEKREGITAEVAIYSIVNSLTELSNVYKVQFLINGATRKTYQNLDFSSTFERNLEIVEGEQ